VPDPPPATGPPSLDEQFEGAACSRLCAAPYSNVS
jgi:hypothetical protein